MSRLFIDNAITTLATGITGVETEMTVAAGDGAGLPVVDGTDVNYFVVTMEDAAGAYEFIRVDHRVGDVLGSVTYPNTRAYDSGPAAQAWIAADIIDVRWTAASMSSIFLPSQDLIFETNNLYDFGSDAFRVKDMYIEGNIDTNGLVDGRDVLNDGTQLDLNTTKLDTITWTGAAIKALYEAEANAFTDAKNTLLNAMYHVGFVMLSTVATNPSTLGYPGTWTQIAKGRTIIGEGAGAGLTARTAGAEVGQEDAVNVSHNHDIDHNHPAATSSSDGAHTHTVGGVHQTTPNTYDTESTSNADGDWDDTTTSSNGAHTHSVNLPNFVGSSSTEGESATDKNMQPSLVTYIWERTS